MTPKDDIYKSDNEEGDSGRGESGSGTTGGQGGHIEFKEFIGSNQRLRDDLLPADEKKRLLIVHLQTHEARVLKQKELRDQRKALKEGKITLNQYRQGLNGSHYQYKVNPILAKAAQFSGIDRQVNFLPNENVSETNQENRHELQLNYDLKYKAEYQNTPRFNPKPTPYR